MPKSNSNQGLNDEIKVNNVKVENVKWLKRGEFIHNELTQDILEKIKRVDQKREESKEVINKAA